MPGSALELKRDAHGALVYTDAAGAAHAGVVPVRAFPFTAAGGSIALTDADGRELAWVEDLSALDAQSRELIETELTRREFTPRIERIDRVSSFVTPCTWTVRTDRGETQFILRGEEAIRRLPPAQLLIADSNGIHYLVPDTARLDEHSRRLLDRFL